MPNASEAVNEFEFADDAANIESDSEYVDGNEDSGLDEEFVDPVVAEAVEKLLAKREKELADAIARGDTKNGVYKGLQRHLSARERENQALQAQLRQALAQLEEYRSYIDELSEGLTWASNTMLSALPDDDRQSALLDLQARKAKLAERQLELRRQAMASAAAQPSGTEVPEYVRVGRQKFIEMSRDMAKRFGVDPDDSRLDYGDDEDPFITRYEKFHKSLQELIAEGAERRVAGVRQRVQPVGTRTGGGGGVSSGPRRLSLEEASRQVLSEIRRRDFGYR